MRTYLRCRTYWREPLCANLAEATFVGVKLIGADLSSADLSKADFTATDLSDANLTGANLSGTNLTGAYLKGSIGLSWDCHSNLLLGRELGSARSPTRPTVMTRHPVKAKDSRPPTVPRMATGWVGARVEGLHGARPVGGHSDDTTDRAQAYKARRANSRPLTRPPAPPLTRWGQNLSRLTQRDQDGNGPRSR